MPDGEAFTLCDAECHLRAGHAGPHSLLARGAWSFLSDPDRKKLQKAGYATPRGGKKGAYQNHVYRNNRVIVPYEKLAETDLTVYGDGHIIRLFPHQYFSAAGVVRPEVAGNPAIAIGTSAFILYRTHDSLTTYPPLPAWQLRRLEVNGQPVTRRTANAVDAGHYVLRIPKHGNRAKRFEGADQGIFAPEYANEVTNFLCQSVLAWLMVRCQGAPYTTTQARHIKAILERSGLFDEDAWQAAGILRHGATACPLCSKTIGYSELTQMLTLEEEDALLNAGVQVEGATRSTVVNLFHMEPLAYGDIKHQPLSVAWGHAVCNTKLGQRKCYSLQELQETGYRVARELNDGPESFGWISQNWEMIRSPEGSVWIRLCGDGADQPAEPPPNDVQPPVDPQDE